MRVARSKNFAGPYEKYNGGELLRPSAGWKCIGHGTFVQSASGVYYFLSHAYNEVSDIYTGRQGMLSTLSWPKGKDWPVMNAVATELPVPEIHDDFNGKTPGLYWRYDLHKSIPVVRQENGNLILSGNMIAGNTTGILYGVRPYTAHYSISTTVTNDNDAVKGLSFYGTFDNAIGIGYRNNVLTFWRVKAGVTDNIDSVVFTTNTGAPLELKMEMLPDKTARAFYRQGGVGSWNELKGSENISVDFLPQWDRAPRVGLFFKGDATQDASFGRFDLVNLK
ncbi:family 43 glycosylhydrolase [Ferruginibacter sp.]